MNNAMLQKWEPAAWENPNPPRVLTMPLYVLVAEAIDVARFFNTYYESQPATAGKAARPGLKEAVIGGLFRPELGTEILELQEATQAAQTQHMLTVTAPNSVRDRADYVLAELVASLEYLFDDGVEDEDDQRLERLAAAHRNPTSQDALAAALDDYAGMANMHRELLTKLAAFDETLIDEASTLALALREISADKLAGATADEQKRTLELRNRLAGMLYERMQLVRAAARYVFRHDPETVRRVTSAYQRQRTARYRRSREEAAAAEQAAAEQAASAPEASSETAEAPTT